jgi:hypothetical protein
MKGMLSALVSAFLATGRQTSVFLLFGLILLPGANAARAQVSGGVVVWGYSVFGLPPVPAPARTGVTAIAAGAYVVAAVKTDGSVVVWGEQPWFRLKEVPLAARSGVASVAAGGGHLLALRSDGSVIAWGDNTWGQIAVPPEAQTDVTAVAAGSIHSVVLRTDGTVIAWGANHNGQVTGTVSTTPPFLALANPVTLGGHVLSGITAIAAGEAHTVALKSDGSVVAWGRKDNGQADVPIAAQSHVIAIAAGGAHNVALKDDGSVVAWGFNISGQVTGNPTPDFPYAAVANPVTLGGKVLGGVTAVAAGGYHSAALKDGSIVAWGYNQFGQTTVPPAAKQGVKAIATGPYYTAALVIPAPPVITASPLSQTVNDGESAGFAVTATGQDLNYQWRKDGADLLGATSASYAVPVATFQQAGIYTVVVSNGGGSVTSSPPAVLTVNPIPGVGVILRARSTISDLVLAWPANAVGYKLQWTPGLQPPVKWTDSTEVPVIDGTQFTVISPISEDPRFFRVWKP